MLKLCRSIFLVILFFTIPFLPVEYISEFFLGAHVNQEHFASNSSSHDDEEAELFFVSEIEDEEEEEKPSRSRKKTKK